VESVCLARARLWFIPQYCKKKESWEGIIGKWEGSQHPSIQGKKQSCCHAMGRLIFKAGDPIDPNHTEHSHRDDCVKQIVTSVNMQAHSK
jgi:hypothetical protein